MWENAISTLRNMLTLRNYTFDLDISDETVNKLQSSVSFNVNVCVEEPPVIIHLNNEPKIGIKIIRHLLHTMEKHSIQHAVCVFLQTPTPFAKRYLNTLQLENPEMNIECFFVSELQFDITKHSLMPRHTHMSPDERAAVLARYGSNLALYPKILLKDPMARYLGLKKDDMIAISRIVPNQGTMTVYRVACPG